MREKWFNRVLAADATEAFSDDGHGGGLVPVAQFSGRIDQQYRGIGRGFVRGSAVVTSSNPPSGFTDTQVANFIDGRPQSFKLDTNSLPVSIAVAVQVDQDVRAYIPFIANVGNLIDNSLAAATMPIQDNAESPAITKTAITGDSRASLPDL